MHWTIFTTTQQNAFILEDYFQNGIFVDGECQYSKQACIQEFRQQFPNTALTNNQFAYELRRSVTNLWGNCDKVKNQKLTACVSNPMKIRSVFFLCIEGILNNVGKFFKIPFLFYYYCYHFQYYPEGLCQLYIPFDFFMCYIYVYHKIFKRGYYCYSCKFFELYKY